MAFAFGELLVESRDAEGLFDETAFAGDPEPDFGGTEEDAFPPP